MPKGRIGKELELKQLAEHFQCEDKDLVDATGKPRVRISRGDTAGKRCAKCGGIFTSPSFYPSSSDSSKLQSYCKQCNWIYTTATRRGVAAKLREESKHIKEEIVDSLKKEAKGIGDDRIKRKTWPKDKLRRMKSLHKVMPQAIDEYRGELSTMAAALNLPITELEEIIEQNDEFQELMVIAENKAVSEVEAHLFQLCIESNSPTAAMFYLKNKAPNRWSDKSQVEVKNTGFAPPPAGAEGPGSVLTLIQKKGGGNE